MNLKWQLVSVLVFAGVISSRAVLTLSGTSYVETFDNIGSGLPTGWSVNTGASASSVGSAATFDTAQKTWGDTGGSFKNVASLEGLASISSKAEQDKSTDRALGIRQTGSFGDPGAAFELNIQNTAGLHDFSLSVSLQMLYESFQGRSTTWTMDYRVGDSGDFTSLGTYTDPGTFGSTTFTANSTELNSWDNQSQDIWFRVVALSASTGSGSRDTFAIDDFSLTYSAAPEPREWGLISGAGLLALCGISTWRERRAAKPRVI